MNRMHLLQLPEELLLKVLGDIIEDKSQLCRVALVSCRLGDLVRIVLPRDIHFQLYTSDFERLSNVHKNPAGLVCLNSQRTARAKERVCTEGAPRRVRESYSLVTALQVARPPTLKLSRLRIPSIKGGVYA